jgi:hypothetical protein
MRHKYFWCGVDVDVMTNDQLRNAIKIIADQNDGSVKQLKVILECPSAPPGMSNRFHSFNEASGKCVFCGRKKGEIET